MKYQNVFFTSVSVKRYNSEATKTTNEGRINQYMEKIIQRASGSLLLLSRIDTYLKVLYHIVMNGFQYF